MIKMSTSEPAEPMLTSSRPLFETPKNDLAQCVIIAGSNHNADRNISSALDALAKLSSVTVRRFSAPLQTPAMDAAGTPTSQPDYTNLAILLSTHADYQTLRESLRQIESDLGRTRDQSSNDSPCVIDLDIVIFVQPIFVHSEVSHWHYIYVDNDITRLPYIAVPLAWLAPTWVHPETGETMATIAEKFSHNLH